MGEALVHRNRMEMKIAVMPEDFLMVYGLSANAALPPRHGGHREVGGAA